MRGQEGKMKWVWRLQGDYNTIKLTVKSSTRFTFRHMNTLYLLIPIKVCGKRR